jgi:hypothetical protein
MQPAIPLDKILERMREERQPERSALRLYAFSCEIIQG